MMFDFNKLADSDNKYATAALNFFSAVALFAAAAWFSYNMFSTKDADTPPRLINSVMLEPSILLAGKPFKPHINVTLSRLCPYEVRWSLVRQPDGVEVVKIVEPIMQPPTSIGTQDLAPTERYVPNSVAPGDYRYLSEVHDHCADGRAYTAISPSVPITIR
jgi:hypothetical protein